MHVIPCPAPIGPIEIAPITGLALHMEQDGRAIEAFWGADDQYLLRETTPAGAVWYQIVTTDAEGDQADAGAPVTDAERARLGALLASIIPLGGHTVKFPVGSTGRQVYRIWSGRPNAAGVRKTRILGARAARSRRQPA